MDFSLLYYSALRRLLFAPAIKISLAFASSKGTAFPFNIIPVQKSVQNHFCSKKNIYIWKDSDGFPENIRKIIREIFKEFISVEAAGFGPAKTNF